MPLPWTCESEPHSIAMLTLVSWIILAKMQDSQGLAEAMHLQGLVAANTTSTKNPIAERVGAHEEVSGW